LSLRQSGRHSYRDREVPRLQYRWERVAKNLYGRRQKTGSNRDQRTRLHSQNFGEDAFALSIDLGLKLDPSIAPSFTANQVNILAFLYNYTKSNVPQGSWTWSGISMFPRR
jgi:hypothetical protein